MRTIALRFADNFAPPEGTIAAHQQMIDKYGFVWYGKLGQAVSAAVLAEVMKADSPKILLIHSGSSQRYWAYIDSVQREAPPFTLIPEYYRDRSNDFKCWFRIKSFLTAPSDVMQHYAVVSSRKILSDASRLSMSPYFIIEPV